MMTVAAGTEQLGCRLTLTDGAAGAEGTAFTFSAKADEMQPCAFFAVTL